MGCDDVKALTNQRLPTIFSVRKFCCAGRYRSTIMNDVNARNRKIWGFLVTTPERRKQSMLSAGFSLHAILKLSIDSISNYQRCGQGGAGADLQYINRACPLCIVLMIKLGGRLPGRQTVVVNPNNNSLSFAPCYLLYQANHTLLCLISRGVDFFIDFHTVEGW